MAKRSKKAASPGKRQPASVPAATPGDPGAAIATATLVLAIACAGLAMDSGADASFDAPKRLTSLLAAGIAALASFGFSRWKSPFSLSEGRITAHGATALLLAAACAGVLAGALFSPRRALALDAARALFLYALFLPLGASRVLERRKRLLLATFLAVVAINAAVSFLQTRGLYRRFQLLMQGSRNTTGAFVGNTGYLAVALALAAVASFGVTLLARPVGLRVVAGVGAACFAGVLLINLNLTSLTALVAGASILLLARFGRRAVFPMAALLLLMGGGVLVYRPMRERARETVSALRRHDWDRLVTYRFGPWSVAVAMALERPWTGWGSGTFGAEFVPHRLRMEIVTRQRITNPLVTSSYGEAHCDYLQPFAEAGIPAGLAALGAVVLLFRSLLAAARRLPAGPDRAEALFLLAFLGAGAVAALTWFPLQRPISSLPLLLAAGRAWRISGPRELKP